MTTTRRMFLKSVAASGAAAGAVLAFPNILRAAGPVWGDVPSGVWPGGAPDVKCLHVHLLGGMAPFPSFYYRPLAGRRTRGFDTEITNLNWNGVCPGTPAGLETVFFANDSNGKPIHLGPFAKPFWPSHISNRMRVVVLAHNLLPHQAAIPLLFTGLRLGRPNQASLGSPIQHRYRALDADAGQPPRPVPYSYGLLPQAAVFNDLLFSLMGSVGTHGGAAKPLVLRVGPQFATFLAQLNRPGITPTFNDLLDQYRAQYRDFLRFQASAAPEDLIRSKAFRNYDAAVESLFNAPSLSTLLATAPTTIDSDDACAAEMLPFENNPNQTKTAIKSAVFLLTRPPAERARYVHVVDSGITRIGLPYDVHNAGHATDTGSNLWNTLSTLAEHIVDPANPTPEDAQKLDLDDTMIAITMEFGRTPFKSLGNSPNALSLGRDHWPNAFCCVLVGGPITTKGVVGSISDALNAGAVADVAFNPTDFYAALLVAMNINPFETETYALGQLTSTLDTSNHEAGMIDLRQTILGVT